MPNKKKVSRKKSLKKAPFKKKPLKPAAVVPVSTLEKYARSKMRLLLRKTFSVASLKKRVHPLHVDGFHADLTICSLGRMTSINAAYRQKKEPTDVLSFLADEFFQRQGILGEIVICAPVVLKQAREFNHSWKNEIDALLVHGILHLLHFDHELGESEAKEMHQWERKLLGAKNAKSLIVRVKE